VGRLLSGEYPVVELLPSLLRELLEHVYTVSVDVGVILEAIPKIEENHVLNMLAQAVVVARATENYARYQLDLIRLASPPAIRFDSVGGRIRYHPRGN